jgi:hypothetical protein
MASLIAYSTFVRARISLLGLAIFTSVGMGLTAAPSLVCAQGGLGTMSTAGGWRAAVVSRGGLPVEDMIHAWRSVGDNTQRSTPVLLDDADSRDDGHVGHRASHAKRAGGSVAHVIVSGRLIDARSGQPVTGTVVILGQSSDGTSSPGAKRSRGAPDDPSPVTLHTDPNGRFSISVTRGARITSVVIAEGYQPARWSLRVFRGDPARIQLVPLRMKRQTIASAHAQAPFKRSGGS